MPRIVVFLVLIFLTAVNPVFAQEAATPFPTPVKTESSGQVLGLIDIIKGLFGLLTERSVDEKITDYYNKTLPPVSVYPTGVDVSVTANPTTGFDPGGSYSGQEGGTVADVAYKYCIVEQNKQDSLDPKSFFERILAFFGIDITNEGNQCAQDTLNAGLPKGVGEQMIAGVNRSSELAQGSDMSLNTKVLGTQVSDQAMAYAYDCARCGDLPLALCSCGEYAGTNPEENLSPTVVPTGTSPKPTGIVTPPPGELPAVCYQQPVCLPGKRQDCYMDSKIGACWIYTKGFCAVDCLKSFFGDEKTAEKASQICNRESGGNPLIVNRSCLFSTDGINNDNDGNRCIDMADTAANSCPERYYDGATVDYSIGLFQINLLAHCSASVPTYTWDPPKCTFENVSARDACEDTFKQAIENIKEAVDIYNRRKSWQPDNPWGDWSAAGPNYCNVK